jgi:phthalate 4,5-cis-dihydrodiol dehydrogenase
MLPTFVADPRVVLVAAADPRPEGRARFVQDFYGAAYGTVEELCADPAVEIVYVATPHQFHAAHGILAAQGGKHVVVEKPMALTLEDCAAMNAAAAKARVHLIVGHSHSFDAPIARTRALIDSGAFGAVRMIHAFNYTDFLRRPRRPEELDSSQGGGAIFNQAAHQVDIVRLLGGEVKTVRAKTGAWDPARPTEGAYTALLTFESGAFASLTYNGYGHFDSDEFSGWIGEMGQTKSPAARRPQQRFASAAEETGFKAARNYGGAAYQPPAAQETVQGLAHQHFGTVIVSCALADLRPVPNGVMIYQDETARLDPLQPPLVPRAEVIDELYAAVVHGKTALHDGESGMATLEVCLAMLRSSREG